MVQSQILYINCRLLEEIIDICEKHINKAIGDLSEDSETVIAKLVASCGKDSKIPLVMGVDSLFAGIDTTGKMNIIIMILALE